MDVLPRHLGHEGRSEKLLQAVCARWRVPTDCRDLALVVAREHGNIQRSHELGAAAIVRLLERCDAFRKPARFVEVLLACECDARGRLGYADSSYPQATRLLHSLQVAQTVTAQRAINLIAPQAIITPARGQKDLINSVNLSGIQIGQLMLAARVRAVAASLGETLH